MLRGSSIRLSPAIPALLVDLGALLSERVVEIALSDMVLLELSEIIQDKALSSKYGPDYGVG